VRLATYNVKNLFREELSDRHKPDGEFSSLAGSINKLGADIVLLQEVGSQSALDELNARLKVPFNYAQVQLGNSDRDIHLAILSRHPFRLISHREQTLFNETGDDLLEYNSEADARSGAASVLKLQRDLMLAEVATDEFGVLTLFNVHLKSKTNRQWRLLAADVVRSAECRMIASRISKYIQQFPERPVFLAGDFNDTRNSEPLRPLFSIPLFDPVGEGLARTGSNPSTYWPRRRMRIDFILASTQGRRLLVPHGERIHNSQQAKRASDHFPVSVDLQLTAS
jgi:endonuclease/exonuclease/phosphatase family metal-dependent hydrolase